MKEYRILIVSMVSLLMLIIISCSEEFLEPEPPGSYSEPSLQNAKGVEGMLIAAYSALDGSWFESWGNNRFNQNGGASNWVWGGIRSEDSYKGTEPNDGVDLNAIERSEVLPSNPVLNNKWGAIYDGVGKANAAIRNISLASDMTDAQKVRVEAEARALRGFYHFEGVKVFGRVPYVDETVGIDVAYAEVKNPAPGEPFIWAEIEADLLFAYNNLDGPMPNPGRINKYAAGALLAKAYMFQGKWSQAEPILDDIVGAGTTSTGERLALMPRFYDNFRADMENGNTESMFGYEAAFGDGSISNGNYENTLNQPHGSSAPTNCCGFYQPSQNLANSFKVDGSGLPLLDTYNDSDIVTDEGVASTDPFTPEQGPLDARIDWTIGRRGIPFLDWGINPGSGSNGYVRQLTNGGPYNPVKTVPTLAEFDAQLAGVIDWGFTSTAKNVQIVRYADVLLLAAEVKAELGKLSEALDLVNEVRARAANPDGFVMNGNSPAANYSVGLYPSFASQADALKAIRFERKIELAQEGHRFFDLVRWHENSSNSALPFDIISYMNNYYQTEGAKRPHIAGSTFEARNLYNPIPQSVIAQSTVNGVENISQNPGY
ncbi:RagB/SusD family nutrient uptake outer membrane protein [Fulvivirga sedimenti]|uniref:RagB/SusD family nutrient uptake outer membrane protein n=1 Tax=Fulvivirga sedimenti TaxID=2879465 RepID=A0A9X1KZH9_9BACT|nr:RagB/SusD family nutrient uptake outer membrane protein [Fulvivirga sedimenti]MCA6078918.1 RagB/SusD family nutrient uptake outer membrane protein [Fulvivirga sedimenti]